MKLPAELYDDFIHFETALINSSNSFLFILQFNLAIKDYPEVQREAKAALSNGNPKPGRSLVVEISLRTSDSESLMLEVWSIGMTTRYLKLNMN